MVSTETEIEAKFRLNKMERRSQLVRLAKKGPNSKLLIFMNMMFLSIMILQLWFASKQKGYPLSGAIMASNAYVFAILIISTMVGQVNQRINALMELMDEDKSL